MPTKCMTQMAQPPIETPAESWYSRLYSCRCGWRSTVKA